MPVGKAGLAVTPGSGVNLATFEDGDGRRRQIVINGTQYAVTGTYMASSFRVVGAATTPTNLCTVRVGTPSTIGVAIRRLAVDVSVSAATPYLVTAYFRYFHKTGVTPSGGTAPSQKTPLASAAAYMPASSSNVSVLFGASADGTNTAITHAVPSRSPDREQAHPALVTAVGQWNTADYEVVTFNQEPLALFADETSLLTLVGASATHLHYTVKCIWDEFLI